MRTVVAAVAALFLLAGCTGEPDPGPRFDDEGQPAELVCLRHQQAGPGARYTDPTLRRTDESLALLKYYTAHGDKPFCDRQAPTGADRSWAEVYVSLGADRREVAALLD